MGIFRHLAPQNGVNSKIESNFDKKSTQPLRKGAILDSTHAHTTPLYRIGAVSKTTGIPVSTLRVWETRYGAFSPLKTQGKQRLFEEVDVSKALLLKQLSQAGHAISAIANLDLDQLRRMSLRSNFTTPSLAETHQPMSLAIVGLSMANRLESSKFAQNWRHQTLPITHVWVDLATASAADMAASDTPQVLLIKVNTLQMTVHDAIQALIQKHKFAQTVVLYHFATDAMVQAMTLSGLTVRREPLADNELAELLQSVLGAPPPPPSDFGTAGPVIAARKYSDATLSRVAGISNNVLCECPRHVAELISQLASFEQYSQECLNKSADDAQLHAYLRTISGSARALFENALEKIAHHEGIDLNEPAP